MRAATEQNVRDALRALTTDSPILAGPVAEGKLAIVPAIRDVGSGVVTWWS